MPPRKREMSLSEMTGLFKEGLNHAVTRPSIHGYRPHEKQIKFHSASERVRLYIGGNRSGKTVGGVCEDVFWARGVHPFRRVPPPPIYGRLVTTSLEEGIKKIIIPELKRWIPPSDLINGSWEDSYDKAGKTLNFANGSFIELMSYEQDVDKFAGTSRHFIHFDEEPPKPIYDECKMRVLDTGGYTWFTMTPLLGFTWVYNDIYTPGLLPGSGISVIEIDVHENPYVSDEDIDALFKGMDEDEVNMRMRGKFVQISRPVFKEFNSSVHVIPSLDIESLNKIKSWTHYASMDHGLNNPTAWLWHAVSPNGSVVTYDELYDREKVVAYYARAVHERNKLPGRRSPDIYVGDPAIEQRNAQTGDSIRIAYIREGIPIMLGNNNVAIGTNKMNSYLKTKKWAITENCSYLISQLQTVRWKTYNNAKQRYDNNRREEIHKKDDHAPDSARYFFSFMPELYIPPETDTKIQDLKNSVQQLIQATTVPVGPGYSDTNLKRAVSSTEWHFIDETLGGIF